MRLFRVRNDAEEQHRDRHDEKNKGKMGQHKNEPEQDPGPADCAPGLQLVLKHRHPPAIHDLKHRAGIPAILRAEVPDPSHLRKLATACPDLHRVNTRYPRIHPAAINVMHLLIRRDIEPVRPEPDTSRDIRSPPQVLQPQG